MEEKKKEKEGSAPLSLAVAGFLNRCQLSPPLCIKRGSAVAANKKEKKKDGELASVSVFAMCQRVESSKYITQTETCKIKVHFIYLHIFGKLTFLGKKKKTKHSRMFIQFIL